MSGCEGGSNQQVRNGDGLTCLPASLLFPPSCFPPSARGYPLTFPPASPPHTARTPSRARWSPGASWSHIAFLAPALEHLQELRVNQDSHIWDLGPGNNPISISAVCTKLRALGKLQARLTRRGRFLETDAKVHLGWSEAQDQSTPEVLRATSELRLGRLRLERVGIWTGLPCRCSPPYLSFPGYVCS